MCRLTKDDDHKPRHHAHDEAHCTGDELGTPHRRVEQHHGEQCRKGHGRRALGELPLQQQKHRLPAHLSLHRCPLQPFQTGVERRHPRHLHTGQRRRCTQCGLLQRHTGRGMDAEGLCRQLRACQSNQREHHHRWHDPERMPQQFCPGRSLRSDVSTKQWVRVAKAQPTWSQQQPVHPRPVKTAMVSCQLTCHSPPDVVDLGEASNRHVWLP